MHELTAQPEDRGLRVDAWIASRLPELSRSRAQALIRDGFIRIDDRPAKPGQRLAPGMRISVNIPPPAPAEPAAEDIPLDVLYEDADVLVVNKPPGLVVHPAAGHASGTLVNALLFRGPAWGGIGGRLRPGIVHRLDKDTSGVLVAAKNDRAMAGLARQFKDRTVRKTYLAVVWGRPAPPSGRIESLIGRSARDRKRMSASPARGRPAITAYETAEPLGPCALLRVRIETGRTHQIRVHLAHIGHPVTGDRQYGLRRPPPLPVEPARQMLHAFELAFAQPVTGAPLRIEAPMPPDMAALVAALRPPAHAGAS